MFENHYYTIITYGCQMNEYDSEVMAGLLEGIGYSWTDSLERADLIALNTCCVRESAENKVWGMLGKLKKIKEKRSETLLVLSGCMPQQKNLAQRVRTQYPHLDLIIGTHNRHLLPELIKEVKVKKRKIYAIAEHADFIPEQLPVKRKQSLHAWVPVIFGCDNYCTYCVVPYVRGPERSRPLKHIMSEIYGLVANGFREVTLLGQNVNSYGKNTRDGDFPDLLLRLEEVQGLWRIRFTTSHPKDFSSRLIKVMSSSTKACEHIHLPVQSGSNKILKHMNRGYSREDYLNLVEKIRGKIPGVSLTTDLLVGFPGETSEDFAETLDLVQSVGFDQAYTFIYNPREQTPAAFWSGQVSEAEKSARIQELITVQKEISLAKNKALVGCEVEVLTEAQETRRVDHYMGRTRTNKLVVFAGKQEQIGKLVMVGITAAHLTYLKGQSLNKI